MLLPIIDSFIKEVNTLAGDPNSRSFDDELSACLFLMINETNPVNLGCKFFMLNISLTNLRKILTYLSILKLRSDSLRSEDGEPIDQSILTLALKGIVYAIGREEEPITNWKTLNTSPVVDPSTQDDKLTQSSSNQPVTPQSRVLIPPSTVPTHGRSARLSGSIRASRHSLDLTKAMTGPRPGTSKQSIVRQSPSQSESGVSDESTPSKQSARGLISPNRATAYQQSPGRRGRTVSMPSTSTISSLSILAPSSTESHPEPPRSSPSPSVSPIRLPVIIKYEPLVVNLEPSTSSIATTSSSTSSREPTFGLIIIFPGSGSIHKELIQVLDPYRDRIERTPICANNFFIKLKCKKDVYFLKRQIEILTRLMPRIVVSNFSRFTLDVPKQFVPTIKEFVNLNVSILKGEYYVYSRISTFDESLTTIEILASPECQRAIESSSRLLKVGQEMRRAIQIQSYQECPRCFFCFDDFHTECSKVTLMQMDET